MLSLRTSPQAGVVPEQSEEMPLGAIPFFSGDARKIREIPTPVCALARNDSFL